MIRVRVHEVHFDPKQGHYFVPAGAIFPADPTRSVTAEELCSAIRAENYRDALDFISNMDEDTIGEPDNHGQTALHWAAFSDHEELCQALLNKMDEKAICFKTYENHQTALHFAAREGNTKFVNLILKSKFGKQLAETEDKDGKTPLYWAVCRGHLDTCRELYKQMSPPKIIFPVRQDRGLQGLTVLHGAVSTRKLELVQLVISDKQVANDLVKMVDSAGQTALHLATGLDDLKICQALYDLSESAGALSAQTKKDGYTVLHVAVPKQAEIVRLFTEKFKRGEGLVGIVDHYGQTPLHWAAGTGRDEICEILYGKMTPAQIWTPMSPADRKQTALHFAVQGNHQKVVDLLLKREDVAQGLVGVQDIHGQTALHWAAGQGFLEVCQLLYPAMTPEQICMKKAEGYTALHLAVHANRPDVVKLLLSNANAREKTIRDSLVGIQDDHGQTALNWARSKGFSEICELLQ